MKKIISGKILLGAAALAVFAATFFAKPEQVRADSTLEGTKRASSIPGTSGVTATLHVTADAVLILDTDLRYQFLVIDNGKSLTIEDDFSDPVNTLTIDNSANRHPCLSDGGLLTIAGGKVQLKGGAQGGYLNVKTLNITGGTVESLADSCGISADNITISGGTVHLTCPLTPIEARNSIRITGGNIEARSENGPGIYSGGTVNIS